MALEFVLWDGSDPNTGRPVNMSGPRDVIVFEERSLPRSKTMLPVKPDIFGCFRETEAMRDQRMPLIREMQ